MTYCSACKTHNGKHAMHCPDVMAAMEKEFRSRGILKDPKLPADPASELRAKVTAMRELGVLEADGIKLGPLPPPPPKEETEEEWKERQAKIAQRQHDIMFAASGTKPVLRLAKK